jgi:hypothetical protein
MRMITKVANGINQDMRNISGYSEQIKQEGQQIKIALNEMF